MRFVFDPEKAAAAAAYLAQCANGRAPSVEQLGALLYLADRHALVESGYPITGATIVSTDAGPRLLQFPDTLPPPGGGSQALSEFDEEVLAQTYLEFGNLTPGGLADYARSLPEWADAGGSGSEIGPRRILEAAGKSPEEVKAISAPAEAIYALRRAAVPTR
jgi:hypothetical protein